MNLSTKIFLGFFSFIACLLGITLYITRDQTERHEVARIEEALALVQLEFQDRLERHQKEILKLVQTITMDQKFRAFLSQIKDNYYSFTEEIALDAGGDIVFMVDESPRLGGIYPATEDSHAWFKKHLETFRVMKVLDSGKASFRVVSLDDELFSAVYVPLKEALSDDYAIGAIVVCRRIDDAWIKWLFGHTLDSFDIRVVFFSGDAPVAGNVSAEEASRIVGVLKGEEGETGSYLFSGERYLVRSQSFDESGTGTPVGYILSSNLDQALKPFQALQQAILITGVIVLCVGLVFTLVLARRIVKPLGLLVRGTREVAQGNYDVRIQYEGRDEVGQLSEAFNRMIDGLREKERIRDSFNKYVHPSIVSEVLANPENLKLGGTRQVQTVLFSDIAKFTTFSESMHPDVLIPLLNEYLEAMTEAINTHQGVLDKYLGDGIMAFWGPPYTKGNHALLSCKTSVYMQHALERLRAKWRADGHPEFRIRIGLATGEMVVGNIGCEQARSYTCIGDTVNYGARLESLNKEYGTEILIDETTCTLARRDIVVRELDTVHVKGVLMGASVFELVGLEGEIPIERKQLIVDYEKALAIYREGNFTLASEKFTHIYESTQDRPSHVMLERCRYYMEKPPTHWSGTHVMKEK